MRSEKQGFWAAGALPRGNRVFERLADLLVDELEREAFLEVSHHTGLHLAQHDQRFQRRAVFRGDRGARKRDVDDLAVVSMPAVVKNDRGESPRLSRHHALMPAILGQVEDVLVGKPGELGRHLVALARAGVKPITRKPPSMKSVIVPSTRPIWSR